MVPTIKSVSSPALLGPTGSLCLSTDAGEQADQDSVPTCDKVIDLLQLKNKQDLEAAVLDLVRTVLPGWADGVFSIRLQRVSGAMTNAVFFVDAPRRPRLLLRVYGIGCEQVVDRQHELEWLARLSQMSTAVGPQLLATFGNGRFEEYLDSVTLTHDDLRDPETSKQIARSLRELHRVADIYPPSSENIRVELWRNVSKWYAVVRELLNQQVWQQKLKDCNMQTLPSEIERCKAVLDKVPSKIVFAHNDTQYGNVLRLSRSGELVIVDFEYAGYNPRGFDIANHFCEWMYNYHGENPATMNVDDFPSKEEQLLFLQAYLEEKEEGDSTSTPEELRQEILHWVMASHLHWALWGLVQASQSEIDFDYFTYSRQRLQAFRKQLDLFS
ncbi:hypothetical protein VTP01DRAFT_1620 [Rhizomucor pusillus]|uniref:uncharacterized protein n=1 Tax=Rhizomucor pusillus TaxID=4840 RepID=UPI00374384DC